MRKLAGVSAIFLLCLFTVVCSDRGDQKKGADHHEVSISGMKFDPDKLEIKPGDTVVWTNADDRDHTVTAKDGSFKSDNLGKGDTFEHKFTKAGKFTYACSYHPRMKATVIVSWD